MNMATYSYTYQNPVIYVDPNGKQNYFNGANYLQGQFDSMGAYMYRQINKYANKIVNLFNVEIGVSAGVGLKFKATKYLGAQIGALLTRNK